MTAGVGATFGGHKRSATGMGDATLWQEVEESERSNWGKWNFLPALLPSFLELPKVDEVRCLFCKCPVNWERKSHIQVKFWKFILKNIYLLNLFYLFLLFLT